MSPQVGYVLEHEVLPRLKAVIPRSVLCIGSESHEDLVSEATLFAARNLDRVEAKGKAVSGSSAAFYAIQHCKSGRRAVGHSSTDVHGSSTQLTGKSRLESMEQVVAGNEENGGEIFELHDVLPSRQECVSVAVARKLDWQELYADLPPREKAIIRLMVQGKSGSAMAKKLKVTVSAIQTGKRHLAKAIITTMGADILSQVIALPRWQQDLQAIREKMACRDERRHL